ncbi:MAG: tetratricopeptide repeat protein [Burkholderiaceae bacterium]|nr:tetratricopeptide repeat protein [Burkholderiaceae bacterium]
MGRSGKGAKRAKERAAQPARETAAQEAAPDAVRGAEAPATSPTAAGAGGSHRLIWIAVASLALAIGVALWWLSRAKAPTDVQPVVAAASAASAVLATASSVAYVANTQCTGCHEDAARQWKQSHHFMAMALPTPETVRGDFDGATFKHQGVTTRFFRRDGKYFVRTDSPDGKLADFEVAWTFGIDPLQQYLIALPGGRLQPLTIAWDTRKKRWFHLYPGEKAPPGDVMHWTGRYQTANTMCIACHTTGYEKRYDAATDSFDSRWKESNVSCQACHGPGAAHVAWAQGRKPGGAGEGGPAAASAAAPPAAAVSGAAAPVATASAPRYGLTVDFAAAGPKAQVEVCAACHSRRSELTGTQTAGTPLLDEFMPARLDAGLYHADGQQQAEVYVYGSFLQSKMFASGVRCTDCHDAHTLALKAPGNGVCLQCHRETPNPRFPAAAGSFDTPAHHHHKAGSAGAQCAACHMPSATYMQVHPRPDHSLRIPRPDLDAATGAPDACTACHKGKPPAWAAKAIAGWVGAERKPHYGTTFAAARGGAPGADAQLAALAADATQPAIVRATAIAALRAYPQGHDDVRLQATRDADAEVRAAAADSLEAADPAQRVPALAPLLTDSVRGVRTSAARSLAGVDRALFDAAQSSALDAALAETIAAQESALDMPGARLNLAVIYAQTGEPALAEANYLAALKIDPDFTPARANLAQFYSARGQPAAAERVLAEGVKRLPMQGDLQYSLGLVLAEQGKLPEAVAALATAAKLLPDRSRVRYNLGLALQQTGKPRDAERALRDAERLNPNDPAAPYALAVLYAQQQRYADALAAARQAQQLAPGDPQLRQLVQQLQARTRTGG